MEGYKERFQEEYEELGIRMLKLENILIKHNKGELDFELNCPVELLRHQLDVMREYFRTLEERAQIEGINLSFDATEVN